MSETQQTSLFTENELPEEIVPQAESNESEETPIVLNNLQRSLLVLVADNLVQFSLESRAVGYTGEYARADCDPRVVKRMREFRKKLRKARHKDPLKVAKGFLHEVNRLARANRQKRFEV